ncbi:hypothetical protein [Methylomonas koyamae]|uniref:hypothetical protein n=1 Tax=Methylomonas koyamae TaxID=702114 RepID=UPI000BC2F6D9|nr:hypothetical protein [Methylomonas koyamae]ATG91049.1 hypothetical protein MKLM6_2843 [Methylomonas koyamae]
MNHTNHYLSLVAAMIVFSAPAGASTTFKYTYTGNQFDNPAGIYSPQDHISLEFFIDESLIPRNGRYVLPWGSGYTGDLRMTISDGRGSINTTTANPDYTFVGISFDTDANGDINGSWNISASVFSVDGGGRYYPSGTTRYIYESTFNDPISPNADRSYFEWDYESYSSYFTGELIPRNFGSRTISVLNNPGTWTRTTITAIPLPGGMLLFGSALAGW